jgi:hypothetical protein
MTIYRQISNGRDYSRLSRDKRHMTRRKMDINAAKFGINFKNDIRTILALWILNVSELVPLVWLSQSELPDYIARKRQEQYR